MNLMTRLLVFLFLVTCTVSVAPQEEKQAVNPAIEFICNYVDFAIFVDGEGFLGKACSSKKTLVDSLKRNASEASEEAVQQIAREITLAMDLAETQILIADLERGVTNKIIKLEQIELDALNKEVSQWKGEAAQVATLEEHVKLKEKIKKSTGSKFPVVQYSHGCRLDYALHALEKLKGWKKPAEGSDWFQKYETYKQKWNAYKKELEQSKSIQEIKDKSILNKIRMSIGELFVLYSMK